MPAVGYMHNQNSNLNLHLVNTMYRDSMIDDWVNPYLNSKPPSNSDNFIKNKYVFFIQSVFSCQLLLINCFALRYLPYHSYFSDFEQHCFDPLSFIIESLYLGRAMFDLGLCFYFFAFVKRMSDSRMHQFGYWRSVFHFLIIWQWQNISNSFSWFFLIFHVSVDFLSVLVEFSPLSFVCHLMFPVIFGTNHPY